MRLELDDSAPELLGNVGFDPVYGARPLKRAIQAQLENPLAQKILGGRVQEPATRCAWRRSAGQLQFERR